MKKTFKKQVEVKNPGDLYYETSVDFVGMMKNKYHIMDEDDDYDIDEPAEDGLPFGEIIYDDAVREVAGSLFGDKDFNEKCVVDVEWESETGEDEKPLNDYICGDLYNAFRKTADYKKAEIDFLRFCIASNGGSRRKALVKALNALAE